MKALIGVFLISALALGCGGKEPETDLQIAEPISSLAADEQLYTRAAGNLVGQYAHAIQTTRSDAINEYGEAYALQVCQMKMPEITAAHSTDDWSVKRVSDKWRNVAGRADTVELRILATFASPATRDNYLTRWSGDDSARIFHYYEKIVVGQTCLKCHGDLQTVDLDLWKSVRLAYPYDHATGYREGDLRGMFVVEAQYPHGKDLAQLLADGVSIAALTAADTTASDSTAGDTTATDSTAGDTVAAE